jgi:hypothetical protein
MDSINIKGDEIMGSTKRAQYKVFNGTDFDIMNFESDADNHSLYRQAIINGNFDVWQRSTSGSINGSAYTADRWVVQTSGNVSNNYSRQSFTIGQTVVPNNPMYFLRVGQTAASNQTFNSIGQKIEDVTKFSGKTISVSFWAKSDTTRTLSAYTKQSCGYGGSAEAFTANQSFTVTTAWQQFTFVFTLASIVGKTIGINDFTSIEISLPLNTSFTFDLAQVQLNVGATVLPFASKSYAQELQDCLRYYEKGYTRLSYPGTTTYWFPIFYKQKKRISNPTTGAINGTINITGTTVGVTTSAYNEDGLTISNNSTPGNAGTWYYADIYWYADAEI